MNFRKALILLIYSGVIWFEFLFCRGGTYDILFLNVSLLSVLVALMKDSLNYVKSREETSGPFTLTNFFYRIIIQTFYKFFIMFIASFSNYLEIVDTNKLTLQRTTAA